MSYEDSSGKPIAEAVVERRQYLSVRGCCCSLASGSKLALFLANAHGSRSALSHHLDDVTRLHHEEVAESDFAAQK